MFIANFKQAFVCWEIHFETIWIYACFQYSAQFHAAKMVFNTAKRHNQMFLKISPYTRLKTMLEIQLFMY